jgi:hypothetical protein
VGIKNFSSPIPSIKSATTRASTSQASKNEDQVKKKRLADDEEEASISTIEDKYLREVQNCASEITYHVETLWKKLKCRNFH